MKEGRSIKTEVTTGAGHEGLKTLRQFLQRIVIDDDEIWCSGSFSVSDYMYLARPQTKFAATHSPGNCGLGQKDVSWSLSGRLKHGCTIPVSLLGAQNIGLDLARVEESFWRLIWLATLANIQPNCNVTLWTRIWNGILLAASKHAFGGWKHERLPPPPFFFSFFFLLSLSLQFQPVGEGKWVTSIIP